MMWILGALAGAKHYVGWGTLGLVTVALDAGTASVIVAVITAFGAAYSARANRRAKAAELVSKHNSQL